MVNQCSQTDCRSNWLVRRFYSPFGRRTDIFQFQSIHHHHGKVPTKMQNQLHILAQFQLAANPYATQSAYNTDFKRVHLPDFYPLQIVLDEGFCQKDHMINILFEMPEEYGIDTELNKRFIYVKQELSRVYHQTKISAEITCRLESFEDIQLSRFRPTIQQIQLSRMRDHQQVSISFVNGMTKFLSQKKNKC